MDADVVETSEILFNNQNKNINGGINSLELSLQNEMCYQDEDQVSEFVESNQEGQSKDEDNSSSSKIQEDDSLLNANGGAGEICLGGNDMISNLNEDIRNRSDEFKSIFNNSSDAPPTSAVENQDPVDGSKILMPTTATAEQSDLSDIVEQNHEVIAISDDEDGDSMFRQSSPMFSQRRLHEAPCGSSFQSMNFAPMPSLPMSMSMPPPPLRRMFPPHSFGGPNDVITLSDDEDDEEEGASSIVGKSADRRKKSSRRRRGTMFNPIICPYCYKPKRETVCMSKHMISRHWMRVRSQNMGTTKSTDYANIKDDREIPVEKYKEDRFYHSSPSSYPPPPTLSGPGRPSSSRSHMVEQPLRPSFPGVPPPQLRGAFSRPVSGTRSAWSPSTIVTGPKDKEESKSLGQEVAEELGHPSNRKLVQSQLSLLMHANKCELRGTLRKQNSFFEEEKTCSLPDCAQTKELLRHLPSCQAETDCPVAKCFMSKQIVKWALSPNSPDTLRQMRNELLNKQTHNGLPPTLVEWASKNKFEKQEWKSSNVGNVQQNALHEKAIDQRTSDNVSAIGTNENSGDKKTSDSDWKMKYQQAKEKMKTNLKSQKMKNGQEASIEDKIVPSSPASVDILSSLLSAQTQSADLRRSRKREGDNENEKGKKMPKLIPAPEGPVANGDEAAQFNSMLSL